MPNIEVQPLVSKHPADKEVLAFHRAIRWQYAGGVGPNCITIYYIYILELYLVCEEPARNNRQEG